jgi:trehalose/maltose hydrolase-like predicted phosphorylase
MTDRWAWIDAALAPAARDGWLLHDDGFDPLRETSRQSRYAISNGFLGIRATRTLNRAGGPAPYTSVAGLFDVPGSEQPIPQLMPAADWLQLAVGAAADGAGVVPLDFAAHRRCLDLAGGALHTGCEVSEPRGAACDLRTVRLVSLAERGVGLQLMRLAAPEGTAEITVSASFSGLDGGMVRCGLEQDVGVWRTRVSGRGLAIAAWVSLSVGEDELAARADGPFGWSWTWHARPGGVAYLQRLVCFARTDTAAADPAPRARASLAAARRAGGRAVLAAHEAAWSDRWRQSDVAVQGDPASQRALRFAIYHLNGAANPQDEHVSIGARALTGDDYRGHVFWDTEIFLLPFYSLTWPRAARAMLMYRFRTLDEARAKAVRLGWRGALYAWESADTGADVTPEHAIGPDRRVVDILCGTQEQHITADVAYAVWRYWLATGDEDFLRQAGCEILLDTARFWISRAVPEPDGRRHIRGVIGPDEYHENIDDNAFTNVMARHNIACAVAASDLLKARWPDDWRRLSAALGIDDAELASWPAEAARIVTGLDAATGLYEQFAGYFGLERIDLARFDCRSVPMDVVLGTARTRASQIVKQADVVALLTLLPSAFAGETAAANFAFYEPRCSHGSSLSRAMHGIAAARLGLSRQALAFLARTAAIDMADSHAAIDGGIHIAALGGIWQIAVLGFAGVSLHDHHLALDPILPDGWASMEFPIQWRGRHLRVGIQSAPLSMVVTLQAGEPMTLRAFGRACHLSREAPLRISPQPAGIVA